MSNHAFVFPGQGSQYVGMGADALADWPRVGRVLRRVEELTGHRIVDAMLRGPEERLRDTTLAQLSIFGLSTALCEILAGCGARPSVVAGHSLGEFSALVAGGWLDADAAAVTVARRAEAMAQCCRQHRGAMLVVLGVDAEVLNRLLAQIEGTVVLANANTPRQVVVSGDTAAVAALGLAIAEAGVGATVPLAVAGAFHSPLMAEAENELAPVIADLPLRRGHTPLISSVTGEFVTDVEEYRAALAGQITAPVRWINVTRLLLAQPVDTLIEVGPGTVLGGLIRKVDRHRPVHSCRSAAELRALGLLGGHDEVPLSA